MSIMRPTGIMRCPRCSYQGEGVPYFRRGGHVGLLVGISAGAAVSVAYDVARALGPGRNVVVVLPDTGERYFSLDEFFA